MRMKCKSVQNPPRLACPAPLPFSNTAARDRAEKAPLFLAPLYPEPLRPRDGDGRIVERGEDVADRRRAVVPHVDAGIDHGPEFAEDSVNVSAEPFASDARRVDLENDAVEDAFVP